MFDKAQILVTFSLKKKTNKLYMNINLRSAEGVATLDTDTILISEVLFIDRFFDS